MKKIFLTILAGGCLSLLTFAGNADIFSYDAGRLDQEMAQLQALEDYVAVNPGITLSGLTSEQNSLLGGMNLAEETYGGMRSLSGEPALGIPSFLWGCCLGWVGILIVHLVAEDKAETKKALMGCIVGSLVSTVVYVVIYVVYFYYIFGYYYY